MNKDKIAKREFDRISKAADTYIEFATWLMYVWDGQSIREAALKAINMGVTVDDFCKAMIEAY